MIEIIINNEHYLDIDTNTINIVTSYNIERIEEITKRLGGRTLTIDLPPTDNNKQILGHEGDINVVNSKSKIAIKILDNSEIVIEGYLKIIESPLTWFDNANKYKVIAYGHNNDWINKMQGVKLKDLIYKETHIYNHATQLASETAGLNYVYGLVNYGNNGKMRGRVFLPTMRYPAVNITDLIIRLFSHIGYKVSSTTLNDSFFSKLFYQFTTTTDEIVPYEEIDLYSAKIFNDNSNVSTFNNRVGYDAVYDAPPTVDVSNDAIGLYDNDTSLGYYDNSNQYNTTTKEFIAKDTRSYNIKGSILAMVTLSRSTGWELWTPAQASHDKYFQNTTPYVEVGYRVYKNNVLVKEQGIKTGDVPTFNIPYSDVVIDGISDPYVDITDPVYLGGANIELDYNLDVNTGDVIKVVHFTRIVNLFLSTWTVSGWLTRYSVGLDVSTTYDKDELSIAVNDRVGLGSIFPDISFTPNNRIAIGQTVNLSYFLPRNNALDFLKGVQGLGDFLFSADVNKREIKIESRDNFYSSGKIVDITHLLDKSFIPKISYIDSNFSKELLFTYKKDNNDKLLNSINDGYEYGIYTHSETLSNETLKEATTIVSNNYFSATYMRIPTELGFKRTAIPTLWKQATENTISEFSTNFEPRVLYYNGVRSLESGESWNDNGTIRTDYPSLSFVNPTYKDDNSLSYKTLPTAHGLRDKYFGSRIEQLNNGRKVVARLNLDANFIANFKFEDTYYIEINRNGAYLNLTKIEDYKSDSHISVDCTFVTALKSIEKPVLLIGNNPIWTGGFPVLPGFTGIGIAVISQGALYFTDAGNDSQETTATMIGNDLTASKDGQVLIGSNNTVSDAELIIAKDGKNVLEVENGEVKINGSSSLKTTVSSSITDMYTTVNGKLIKMLM